MSRASTSRERGRLEEPPTERKPPEAARLGGAVIALPFVGDDRALLDGMARGHVAAIAAFCDRYGIHVLRLLTRLLGSDSEIEDLHHEVLLRALRAARTVKEPALLQAWLSALTVNVVRTELKRRARRRWFTPLSMNEEPDVEAPIATEDDVEAVRRTYSLLERMPVDLRIPLTLRVIEGMDLRQVADCCGISLSTAKRRLASAEERFGAMASKDSVLAPWLARGRRWSR